MERREFVRLSAYTALILTLPVINGCHSGNDVLAQPLFFSHITDVKTIKEAGLAYRKSQKSEDDIDTLAALLTGNYTSSDKKVLQTLLDDHVRQDFRNGKTVTVSGWVLSVTEARQCALFSMLNT